MTSSKVISLRGQSPGTEMVMLRYLGISVRHRRCRYPVQQERCRQVGVLKSVLCQAPPWQRKQKTSPSLQSSSLPKPNQLAFFLSLLKGTATVGYSLTLLHESITFQKRGRATFTAFLSLKGFTATSLPRAH